MLAAEPGEPVPAAAYRVGHSVSCDLFSTCKSCLCACASTNQKVITDTRLNCSPNHPQMVATASILAGDWLYVGFCVPLSQQTLISMIALQPLEMPI